MPHAKNTDEPSNHPETKNWHFIYYLIGGINFAITAVAFYSMHLFLQQYETLLIERASFSSFFTQVIALKDAGTQLNQPGNSIFQSQNTTLEMQKLADHEKKFQQLHDQLYTHWIKLNNQEKKHPLVQKHIHKIGDQLQQSYVIAQKMVEKAKQVLTVYGQDQKELASVYMAEMDHYFSEFSHLSSLNLILGRDIESGFLQQEKIFLELSQKRKTQFFFLLVLICFYSVIISEKTKKNLSQKQKAILESEYRLKAVMNAAADGIITINQEGIILSSNPKLESIFGYTPEELIGHNISMLVTPGHQIQHNHYIENYLKTKQSNIIGQGREVEGLKKSGETFPLDLAVSPLLLENATQFVGIIRDISERKTNEKKMLDYSNDLSDKITQLESSQKQFKIQTKELHDAKMKADEALVSKSQFLASISHEIRTPMNAIVGFSKLLKKTSLNTDQQDKLKRVEDASEHLLGIINDILDFSKIEAGKMQIEEAPFSLREEMRKVIEMYYSTTLEKGLGFFTYIDPAVFDQRIGDALRLRQIIMNLISNAIKFTHQGHLLLEITQTHLPEAIQISLKDTGIGMNAEQQARLFQPFTQADGSVARQFGGTGLGLNISQQLTELMHGRITLKSVPKEGTTFIVSLLLPIEPTQKNANDNNSTLNQLNNHFIELGISNLIEKELLRRTLSQLGFATLDENNQATPTQANQAQQLFARIVDVDHAIKITENTPVVATILISSSTQKTNLLNPQKFFLLKPPYLDIDLFTLLTQTIQKEPEATTNIASHSHLEPTNLLKNKRCLLVEDNENNQILAQCLLEEMGLFVSIAQHGLEAIEQLKKSTFDIILMDMQMPVMDGLTATQKIRTELNLSIPILAMTANAMVEDKIKCKNAGMNDHISKPIVFGILEQKLTQYLCASVAATSKAPPLDTITPKILSSEILDIEGALARINQKKQLYQKILKRFTEDYVQIEEKLNLLIINQQYEEAARFAHTLKGVAGTVGAVQVQKHASMLEKKINLQESADVLKQEIAQCQVYTTAAIERSHVYLSQ